MNLILRRTGLSFRLPSIGTGIILAFLSSTAGAEFSRTYTRDADFDQGTLVGVNHEAPNNDQLQLDVLTEPFPFLWVPCSARGTIARLDVQTGESLGEYRTAPEGRGLDPSRTSVDLFGNVWVANRAESESGSVVKIGLVIGGTRGIKNPDGTFTPDPNGGYLQPPFTYSTCVDRDGDGLIRTSTGLGDVLDWPDVTDGAGGSDGLVEDAFDECILVYQRLSGPEPRHVSVDADSDVWVGSYPFMTSTFDKLDGNDGSILTTITPGCGAYGGLVDKFGVLWSTAVSQGTVLRYDPSSGASRCIPVTRAYGLGVDSQGFLWASMWSLGTITKIGPSGTVVPGFPKPVGGTNCRGVDVTPADDHVWVANSASNTVSRLDNDGNVLKVIPVGVEPTGVSVDTNGKVWVANLGSDSIVRIDPAAGSDGLGDVDLTVDLGAGAGPYALGNMTRQGFDPYFAPEGSWNVIAYNFTTNDNWGRVSWNSLEPAGTGLSARARASDTFSGLAVQPYVDVFNGVSFNLSGRYIQVDVTFTSDPEQTVGPTLYDLTLESCTAYQVAFGESWSHVSLQEVLDQEYGPGAIDVATGYEGYQCGDADPAYWEDAGLEGIVIREIAGFESRNIMGWYEETLAGPPSIDGVGDGVIFRGSATEGSTAFVTFPQGLTRFGFYLNPNGTGDSHNAPEPEMFFTNRYYNDIGPDGSGAIHAPDGGDPQCLVYNITHLRGAPTYVLAWEDLDSGSEIVPSLDPNGTDNDFTDLVVEVTADSPVPAAVAHLEAQEDDAGIVLRWRIENLEVVDALELWRSVADEPPRLVASWRGRSVPLHGDWTDGEAAVGRTYRYELTAESRGFRIESQEARVTRSGGITLRDRLVSSVPNPFNPSTRIHFALSEPGDVKIRVYDVAGRLVRTLDAGHRPAGESSIPWNGLDDRGRSVASGSYVVQLVTPSQRDQLRVTLLK